MTMKKFQSTAVNMEQSDERVGTIFDFFNKLDRAVAEVESMLDMNKKLLEAWCSSQKELDDQILVLRAKVDVFTETAISFVQKQKSDKDIAELKAAIEVEEAFFAELLSEDDWEKK